MSALGLTDPQVLWVLVSGALAIASITTIGAYELHLKWNDKEVHLKPGHRPSRRRPKKRKKGDDPEG